MLAGARRARLLPVGVIDYLLIFGGLALLAIPDRGFGADSFIRYQGLNDFATRGTFSDNKFTFIGPFFALPLWYLGQLKKGPHWWVGRYNLLLFGLFLLALWVLLKDRIDRALLRTFLLLLVGASLFPWHTMAFLGEMFTTVLVAVAVILIASGRGRAGWPVAVVGAGNMAAAAVALGLVSLERSFRSRRLRYLLAPVAAIGLIVLDTWLRRRQLLVTSYFVEDKGERTLMPFSGRPGFSYPLFFGLLSVFFSFGKGLIFFVPGLLLPVRARLRAMGREMWEMHLLWLWFLAGLVLIYAQWWAWYGGFAWGPRFFLFASVPASFALALWLWRPPPQPLLRLLLLVVLGLSVWVAANGIVYEQSNLGTCIANNFALEHVCWYVPEFSALWHPFVEGKLLSGYEVAYLVFSAAVFARFALPLLPGLWVPAGGRLPEVRGWVRGWRL